MTDLLLKFVEELGSNESFWSSQNRGRKGGSEEKKVGSSNIRSLAVLANNADCYEELRLFIEYKIAKGMAGTKNLKVTGCLETKYYIIWIRYTICVIRMTEKR